MSPCRDADGKGEVILDFLCDAAVACLGEGLIGRLWGGRAEEAEARMVGIPDERAGGDAEVGAGWLLRNEGVGADAGMEARLLLRDEGAGGDAELEAGLLLRVAILVGLLSEEATVRLAEDNTTEGATEEAGLAGPAT